LPAPNLLINSVLEVGFDYHIYSNTFNISFAKKRKYYENTKFFCIFILYFSLYFLNRIIEISHLGKGFKAERFNRLSSIPLTSGNL
jgi:hypothetical protein